MDTHKHTKLRSMCCCLLSFHQLGGARGLTQYSRLKCQKVFRSLASKHLILNGLDLQPNVFVVCSAVRNLKTYFPRLALCSEGQHTVDLPTAVALT